MDQLELYDVLVRLDEKYTEEAETFLFTNKADFTVNAQCKRIKTSRLTVVAVSIIAMICIMAIILSLPGFNLRNGLKENINPIVTGVNDPTIIPLLQQSNLNNLTTNNGKEMPPDYFAFISIPSAVTNNSEFEMNCSFGIDFEDPIFHFYDDFYFSCTLSVSNRTYEITSSFNELSDCFSFFGKGGNYEDLIEPKRLKESFAFDSGREVLWDGDTLSINFANINNADSLPYKLSVPVKANEIKAGTKGFISTGIVVKSKPDFPVDQSGNGTVVYYYCSGDYIGFGSNENEAFDNAFKYIQINDVVNNDNIPQVTYNKCDIYCDDYLYLYPVNITNNYKFEKGKRISVLFELRNEIDDADYRLEYFPQNIYNPTSRVIKQNDTKYYEISFWADPDTNGKMRIEIIIEKDGAILDVFKKGITIYTANSKDETFVSVASMETAMKLAKQIITVA